MLGEAESLRKADAIRAYVQDVRVAAPSVSHAELDALADWALDQADRLEPVISGTFLRTRINLTGPSA